MTLYSDLNVSPSASADEIKKAYRRKASKAHPDRKGGDKAAFQKIQKAYEILGDPVKRL
ncbi:DnaJ domain-containing protein, partial [Klebsiella pneumoniae]|uniref:DnaJ domain-containing protein n=1 Tax=Klebsiella pneumoniae TaxID=573 RepID=UPI003852242B